MSTLDTTVSIKLFQSPTNHDSQTIETPEIASCPFCGSPAQLRASGLYADSAYSVKCTRCHVTTTPIAIGEYMSYHGVKGKTFTQDEAQQEAIRIWNARI